MSKCYISLTFCMFIFPYMPAETRKNAISSWVQTFFYIASVCDKKRSNTSKRNLRVLPQITLFYSLYMYSLLPF
jgi:hypothetical protein